jgi:MFS family permease
MAATDDDDVEIAGEQHGVANFTRSFHVELRERRRSTWNNAIAAMQQNMISLQPYAELLARPELRRSFLLSVIGRLPIGLTGLAILLLVQTSSASFARGGAAAACYVVGLAAIAPLLGRAIDRYGPRRILLVNGVLLFPTALIALTIAVAQGTVIPVLLCAAAAGATFPPITVCMRTYFRRQVGNDLLLATAYSAESVLIEIIFIAGPMLVALFVAFVSAAAAVWFAAGCALVGTLTFLRSPALRHWAIEVRTTRSLLGPLAEPRFPALIGVVLCFSAAFGFVEIGVTAYAAETVNAGFAGVLLAVMSAGSALGGLAYGSRGWHFPLARQFALALGVLATGLALLALPWQPTTFALWCALAGIAMAPVLIIQSMLVAKLALPEHATEAFTWTTSALLSGVGIGLAAGGALLEAFPSNAALGAAAASALVAALLALAML